MRRKHRTKSVHIIKEPTIKIIYIKKKIIFEKKIYIKNQALYVFLLRTKKNFLKPV